MTMARTMRGELKRWLARRLVAALLLSPVAGLASQEIAPLVAPAKTAPAAQAKPAPHRSIKLSTKARDRFRAAWGVDSLRVSRVASGNLLRFNFRVTDPAQAAPLLDKASTPMLYAQRAQAMLSVPVMDKVGPLRQTGPLKAGQDYWVTFSNKGNLVASGDRVDVIIGRFHADGLRVE
jgi:hypothetical protein